MYRTNAIIILWGDDFAHENAKKSYENLNTLINALEEYLVKVEGDMEKKYEIKFSSVSNYLQSVMEEAKNQQIEWPRKTGDFWAYNYLNVTDAYWTGYYTTHPDFKRIATTFSDFA